MAKEQTHLMSFSLPHQSNLEYELFKSSIVEGKRSPTMDMMVDLCSVIVSTVGGHFPSTILLSRQLLWYGALTARNKPICWTVRSCTIFGPCISSILRMWGSFDIKEFLFKGTVDLWSYINAYSWDQWKIESFPRVYLFAVLFYCNEQTQTHLDLERMQVFKAMNLCRTTGPLFWTETWVDYVKPHVKPG